MENVLKNIQLMLLMRMIEKKFRTGKGSIKIEDDDSSKVPGFGISMFSLLFPILLILISNVFSMFLEKVLQ